MQVHRGRINNASSVLMPMLFGSAGAVIGVGGLFWVVGCAVGTGARTAWRMGENHPPESPKKGKQV